MPARVKTQKTHKQKPKTVNTQSNEYRKKKQLGAGKPQPQWKGPAQKNPEKRKPEKKKNFIAWSKKPKKVKKPNQKPIRWNMVGENAEKNSNWELRNQKYNKKPKFTASAPKRRWTNQNTKLPPKKPLHI